MKLKYGAAIFGLLLVAAMGAHWYCDYRYRPVIRSNSQILSIINSATTVKTYRVKETGHFYNAQIGGYIIEDERAIPDPVVAKQLKAVLRANLHDRINPLGQKGCPPPQPGVALRFVQGEQTVEVLVCLHCYDLLIVNEAPGRWRDFMRQRDEMVRIAKLLFPDDAMIQSLPVEY